MKTISVSKIVFSGLAINWSTHIFHKDTIQLGPKSEKEKFEARLKQLGYEGNKNTGIKPQLMIKKREPRVFFEKSVLEAMSKVAIYHLLGFVGYLPYISDVVNYLIFPAIPVNLIIDGYFFHMLYKRKDQQNIFEQTYESKEYCKITDYTSWAFAFISAGGNAKGLPPFVGMICSMYLYTLIKKQNYNKSEAIIVGSIGATLAKAGVMYIAPSYIGRVKKIPYLIGTSLIYAAFSSFICYLIDIYIEGKHDGKLPSSILSTYKWSYVSLFFLTSAASI